MMRFMSMALAFCVMSLTLTAADDTLVQKNLKALEGSWKAVSGILAGQEIPKEKLPRTTYVLHADGLITEQTPQGETMGTMTIDPAKDPKIIDFVIESGTDKGKKQYAIYKLEGD